MLVVTAAVIERDGLVLICRRRDDQDHPGKWEFPGGKVELGETPAAALARELQEELNCNARLGNEINRFRYQYPGKKPIELIFFHVSELIGEISTAQFSEVKWAPIADLPQFDFLEGDVEFIQGLAQGRYALNQASNPSTTRP